MKYLFVVIAALVAACGQKKSDAGKPTPAGADSLPKTNESTPATAFAPTDKTVKFLWREDRYDEALKDTVNTIVINEAFCKTLTDPEKAALGYVATFIGNECSWDGAYTNDRSNLKCKVLTALNLGYQCSAKHLGFLRQLFKNDAKVLEELATDNCPTTPDGATIQSTFDEISLTVKGNEIAVSFAARSINVREDKSRSWTETDHFQLDNDNIRLIKKDESKVKYE